MNITVDRKRCPQNHSCPAVKVCPANAIKQQGYGLPEIDQGECVKCKKCIMFCPMKAIRAT